MPFLHNLHWNKGIGGWEQCCYSSVVAFRSHGNKAGKGFRKYYKGMRGRILSQLTDLRIFFPVRVSSIVVAAYVVLSMVIRLRFSKSFPVFSAFFSRFPEFSSRTFGFSFLSFFACALFFTRIGNVGLCNTLRIFKRRKGMMVFSLMLLRSKQDFFKVFSKLFCVLFFPFLLESRKKGGKI